MNVALSQKSIETAAPELLHRVTRPMLAFGDAAPALHMLERRRLEYCMPERCMFNGRMLEGFFSKGQARVHMGPISRHAASAHGWREKRVVRVPWFPHVRTHPLPNPTEARSGCT